MVCIGSKTVFKVQLFHNLLKDFRVASAQLQHLLIGWRYSLLWQLPFSDLVL